MSEIANIKPGLTSPITIRREQRSESSAGLSSTGTVEQSKEIRNSNESSTVKSPEKSVKTQSRWIKSGDLFAIQTRFKMDLKSDEISAEIVDSRTGDILMKIPNRELIEMLNLSKDRGRMVNITA